FFTEDQYKQLVKLLSKPATLECSTNMTGIISLLANVGMCDWVIDTGATHDVTYSKDILSSVRKIEDQERNEVQLPTGNKAQITHTREASVLGNKTVKNVLYVPYFKFNMLSVLKITRDLNCLVTFFPDFCMFQDLYSGKVMGIERNSVLIGYSKTQKGYTLYDLDSKRVSISRDVSFREQVFPFKEGHQIIEDLFPWAESFVTHDISPEQLEQDSFSEEQATTTHDQVELVHDHIPPAPVMDSPAAADTQTTEPIETTIYSVGTSAMHQPVEQVEEQPVTDPATSQSHEEQVHTDEAVRKSSRTTRPPIWMKDYAT
ncbi:hypothetical protein A4A49_58565, partial [Nicotiana attenuata]